MRINVELLTNLSKHLERREPIKWRLVCKQWRSFIDEFCLDEPCNSLTEARWLDFYDILPDRHPHLRLIQIDNRKLTDLGLNFLPRLDHLSTTLATGRWWVKWQPKITKSPKSMGKFCSRWMN